MRLGALIVALCGCNSLFGLHETQPNPPYFDAPIDAPFACPPLGDVPRFGRLLHQLPQDCRDYTVAADHAVAMCREPAVQIGQGSVDGALAPIAGLEQSYPIEVDEPHLAPEGNELFVRRANQTTSIGQVEIYQRGANDTWTLEVALTPAITDFTVIGSPTRGPQRRFMMIGAGDGFAHEYELDGVGGYTSVATYTLADLGIGGYLQAPNLSPDGLRMVFAAATTSNAGNAVYYSDRPSLAERFRTPVVLPGVPDILDPFMTEDCGRVYFSAGVGSVFWIEQP